jgi:hypothetical protein
LTNKARLPSIVCSLLLEACSVIDRSLADHWSLAKDID